jgi:hypothetical protein
MQFKRAFLALLALCALALAACDPQQMISPFVPQKEAALGKSYVEDIRLRNFGAVRAVLDPRYRDEKLDATLEKLAEIFPSGEPKSVKIVGSHTMSFKDETDYDFLFEYEFPNRWVLGHVYFKKVKSDIVIERMDVVPLRGSLEQQNAFTLAGKTPLHFLFLALAVLLPVFTIATAVVCARMPRRKWKWLWVIFSLIAVPACSLNWTTGAVSYNLLHFLLLGGAFMSVPYGAVMLQIGFPLGAILFWIRRRKWNAMNIQDATLPFN